VPYRRSESEVTGNMELLFKVACFEDGICSFLGADKIGNFSNQGKIYKKS